MYNTDKIDKFLANHSEFIRKKIPFSKWFLDVLKNKKNGFFIEAGADIGHAPGSHTDILEKEFGWNGICVEPHSISFEYLKNHRKCCNNHVLYSYNGTINFLEITNSNLLGFSTIEKHLSGYVNNLIVSKGWKTRVVEKKCITLQSLLEKYNAPHFIDYMSLDTEGSELQVLETLNFEEYKILCISIEGAKCNDLLKSKGFLEVTNPYYNDPISKNDVFFIHPENIKKRAL